MNWDIETSLGSIAAGVSRLEGLYSKWAQKNGNPYGMVQVFYILRLNGAVTQKRISEICEIPKQTVNSVIKQLKADKHITLKTSDEDKREKIIQLTPLGEAYTQKILEPFFELNEMVVNRVGMDLLNQLTKGLTSLGDALELEMELKEVSSRWENKKRQGRCTSYC